MLSCYGLLIRSSTQADASTPNPSAWPLPRAATILAEESGVCIAGTRVEGRHFSDIVY